MARPHVFVWWDEFDRRDLPCLCMSCGKKKADWVSWRVRSTSTTGETIARSARRRSRCAINTVAQALKLSVISASDYDDDQGVWTMNVHEDFVAALKNIAKREVQAWKAEDEEKDPDDVDQADLPPGLRGAGEAGAIEHRFFLGIGARRDHHWNRVAGVLGRLPDLWRYFWCSDHAATLTRFSPFQPMVHCCCKLNVEALMIELTERR